MHNTHHTHRHTDTQTHRHTDTDTDTDTHSHTPPRVFCAAVGKARSDLIAACRSAIKANDMDQLFDLLKSGVTTAADLVRTSEV